MDIGEFEDLLDRLGEDVSRWPAPSGEAARALLKRSREARELEARAVALRRTLAGAAPACAPAGLADRIVARAVAESPPRAQPRTPPAPPAVVCGLALLTRPAVVLSLCFAIGMTIGLLPMQGQGEATPVDFATLLARLVD